MAPEAEGHDDLPGGRTKDISDKTDVYSIGATLFSLMVPGAHRGPTAVRSGQSERGPLHQPTQHVLQGGQWALMDELFPLRQRKEYSEEIREIVARCLEFLPTGRPNMRQLYDTTKHLIEQGNVEPMTWDERDRPPKPPRHRNGNWPHKLVYVEDPFVKFKRGPVPSVPAQAPINTHAVWDGTFVPPSPPQKYSVSPDKLW
ncbi:hypothetical protein LTS18_008071 [Coniosporium uncinatum]|uniref:Uncharacterized protein n=1 Tax=Coniosporium uncinatum TaxID=93489 RepID=A0ACC3D1Z7_9PEZI|nr:hypothetical protein LTS18_008071 [Coniosporium uncinatum]